MLINKEKISFLVAKNPKFFFHKLRALFIKFTEIVTISKEIISLLIIKPGQIKSKNS